MSVKTENIINNFIGAIKESKEKTSPYDTTAEVLRVDGDTVWVHIAGGVDETPIRKTINCEKGDNVQIRVGGGDAWIVGNGSAPPTDDKKANIAHYIAVNAEEKADDAYIRADDAYIIADNAHTIASDTNQYFWHTEEGTDTGVHITEVPEEEWNDSTHINYHKGGNLLARSNGIAVRNGMTELATFGTTTRVGKDGAENVTINSDGISINTSILSTAVNMKAEVVDEETSGIISFGDVYDSGNENAPVVGGYCNQEEAMLKLIGKSLDGMTEGGVEIIASGPDVGNGETISVISASGLGDVKIEGHDGSDDSYIQLTPGAIYIDSSNIKLDDNSFKIAGSRDFYVQNRITQGAHPASTDFDDYMKTGLYLCPGMTDHRPATVSSWVLICIFNNAGSSGVQLAVSTGASYLYKRSYSNSTWSAWTRVQFATYTNP